MSNITKGAFMQAMEKYTKSIKTFISAQGFGHYSKPSGGIPKTDLEQSVQTSLGLADSALQSESDPTVPSWAKASSKPTYTQDEVGDGTTYKRVSATEKTTWNNKGTYSKPSGGIPKTDLASTVQTSLSKADTALQSETYTGTVTQVKVGSTPYDPESGVVSLPAYPTTLPASDVYPWAKASSKPTYTASDVGAIASSAKGTASGVAELDANGKVPSSQLPSYVDDVLEYSAKSSFPETGESGKIYVDTTTNKTYRWSGTAYTEISPSIALGETSSTAYRGDRGKTAYDHSQVTSGNPHNVTKTDVGLGNVGDFKAVSTVASQGLSDTEKANARTNIGAGTSSLALGTSSATAYRGDRGNTAYSHATDSGRLTTATSSGLYKMASTAQGHIASLTPVEKADITALGIPAQDTTYSSKAAASGGTDVSLVTTGEKYTWNNKADTDVATTSADGLMSAADKTKLDGIATGANKYSLPTASSSVLGGVKTGSNITNTSGTISLTKTNVTSALGYTPPTQDTTYNNFVKSGSGAAAGLVPAPSTTAGTTKYLREDGTWTTPPNTTYSSKSAASGGTDVSLCTTGEKYTWNNKADTDVATTAAAGLMSSDDKTKLDGIEAGATANIGTVTQVKVGSTAYNPSSGVVSLPTYPTTLPASDVSAWAKAASKPTYTASEVGAIATTAKGANNGVAELDANGKVPSSQLPSYVDDVLEYSAKSSFPETGESGKIYVDTTTNKTYRWSGTAYTEISPSIALGETSSTAYRGDRGKTAYSHATDSSRLTTATASGLYKVASTAQGHIASLTAVEKADITALGIPAQDTTYGVVSTSANGLAPKVTSTSKFLKGDGTWATPTNTWTAMVGATSSANGSVGYVNAVPPKDGYNTKYLRADGSWQVPPNTTYSVATQTANGLMSSTDKTKLDGIATGANNYSHPTTSGNKHIPSGGSSGQILRWSADGTAAWGADNNTWTAMVGATSSADGSVGYVNAVPPKDGYNTKYLRADGTWQVPPDNNTTYSAATQSTAGLMSASDKTKLDGIATGANKYSLPTATSSVLGGVKTGSNITNSSGTISITKTNVTNALGYTPPTQDTTYSNFVKSGSSAAAGLVPAPSTTAGTTKYLREDGTWTTPPNTTYSVVSTSGNGLAPKVTDTSKFLKGDGTWATPANTWTAMVGATSSANGSVGYVNAVPPKDGYNTKYLRADGSWQVPPNTTYSAATTSAAGLMSATDKTKLDGIATGATAVSESTVSGWGFTKNTGTYSKPSTGIPKTDLASAVQTSLGKADSALQSHQTIKQDGITGATVNRFGTCSTAADTAAKTVSVTSGTFSLEAGARVSVKFTYANTAGTPTLNVNSTGAKNIYSKGSQITTGTNKSLLAGTVDFIYDGTQWHLIGNYIDTNTTYSAATTSAAGLMSASDKTKLDGIATGAQVNTITGVKGDSESSYRTGQVNITPANIGAVPTSTTVNSKALSGNITLTASDVGAATTDHTHNLSIAGAASGSTASINLAANTIYTLTAGGKTYNFKTPADNNSVTGVKGNAESSYRTGQVNITPANIGLGNVGNFKAVSTVASQGLSSTEKSNARANIGAGTSNLTIGTSASTAAAGNHTHSTATTSANGFMSAADKKNVDYDVYNGAWNLLCIGATAISDSNIGIACYEDGQIKISGTAPSADIWTSVYDPFTPNKTATYVLSCTTGLVANKVAMFINQGSTNLGYVTAASTSLAVNLTAGTSYTIGFLLYKNQSFDTTVYPMLCDKIIWDNFGSTFRTSSMTNNDLSRLSIRHDAALEAVIDGGCKNILKLPSYGSKSTCGVVFTLDYANDRVLTTGNYTGGDAFLDLGQFYFSSGFPRKFLAFANYNANGYTGLAVIGHLTTGSYSSTSIVNNYEMFNFTDPKFDAVLIRIRFNGNTGAVPANTYVYPMICNEESFWVKNTFTPYAMSNYQLTKQKSPAMSTSTVTSGSVNDIYENTFALYSNSVSGGPVSGAWFFCRTDVFSPGTTGDAIQQATLTSGDAGATYVRIRIGGSWQGWRQLG